MYYYCIIKTVWLRYFPVPATEPEPEPEPVTYDLSFTINDGTNAIEGATVAIGETTGTTGAAGGCTLREIEEGTQTVTVTATGYVTKTESITVDVDHTSFTISLTSE